MHLVTELLVHRYVYPVPVPGEAVNEPVQVLALRLVELLDIERYGGRGIFEDVLHVCAYTVEKFSVERSEERRVGKECRL